jgi:hypothetical protein
MSILTRFFGKRDASDTDPRLLVANADIKNPLSLQVLFADVWRVDAMAVAAALQSYHPSMTGARCELEPTLAAQGKIVGLMGWGKHVIRFMGFDLPMLSAAVEACVAPAHYPPEMKARARAHRSHLLLFHTGDEPSLLEQYVALAAVAGALASLGALVVLNEAARASFPAAALARSDLATDMLDALRTLPLPALYVGFVKYDVQNVPGVWMRTFGVPRLKLPDFAAHAAGHHEGQRYFDLFNSILRYLLTSGARLDAGHTMQVADKEFLRLRKRGPQEPFLESEGELFVAEIIGPEQVRR